MKTSLLILLFAGTKSVEVTGYSGAFIEIDKANSSKSDSYTITIQVLIYFLWLKAAELITYFHHHILWINALG